MCVCEWNDGKVVSMCSAHNDAARRQYQHICDRTQHLEESLRGIMKAIENNELVRNTAMDHQPDWWKRMVEFVDLLKKARELLALPVLCLFVAWSAWGCSPLRGYKFATHGPGDTSAGDLTHAGEPGARVVVPKNSPKAPAKGPYYIQAFDKPHADCVEIDHKLDTQVRRWACATK